MRFSIASWINFSVSVSMLAVASSKINILGSNTNALAKAINCLCPEDNVAPLS